MLENWDDSGSLARVVAKVFLNDDKKVPDFIKVNASLPTKGKSWTVPCYVLKKSNVKELPDEEAFVTIGPLHPFPTAAPRWNGPVPPAASNTSPANSNAGGPNIMVDNQNGAAGQNAQAQEDNVIVDVYEKSAEKTPEVVRVFDDRYELVSLLCDEMIPSPKVKFVAVVVQRDHKMMTVDFMAGSSKMGTVSPAFHGPCPVLISDLPKVLFFLTKVPALSFPQSQFAAH